MTKTEMMIMVVGFVLWMWRTEILAKQFLRWRRDPVRIAQVLKRRQPW